MTRAASASCSPGGKFKSHQVNTTDWNDLGKAEEWRAQWARYATAMQKEYCNLRGKIAAIGRQIDQMDERLSMWKQYSENKVFHRRLAALKPRVREKFQDAHSVELAMRTDIQTVEKIRQTADRVTIHFSATSQETMSDKIKRMLRNEVQGM